MHSDRAPATDGPVRDDPATDRAVIELFRFDPPELADDEVRRIADEFYGIAGDLQRLRGERSHNTRITTPAGEAYVLRVASASEPDAAIDCHARAIIHLEQHAPGLPLARMRSARNGQLVPIVDLAGRRHRVRLETYLPGVTFDDDQTITDDGLHRIGALLGAVAAGLATFDHPAATGFMAWDIANGMIVDDDLTAGVGDDARPLVSCARPRLERAVAAMATLPRQIIHNDGHAGNLLRVDDTSDTVTGLIDFGDLVHTVTVADIAVAGAALAPHRADPIAAIAALTRGYAAGYATTRDLTGDEIDAIADLVLCRLVLSVLLLEFQLTHTDHLTVELAIERPGLLRRLERWLDIDTDAVAERIRSRR
jgi:hydroxylysine kinase